MKIFALDDEIASLGLLEDAIREVLPQVDLECFTSVKKALERAAEALPDVAFLDIEMPGMTGLELVEKLREIKENINIIFVTGYSQYALDALKKYASDYLLKPVSADDVRKALSNLRYPIETEKSASITIKTFGNFAVFVDEKPVEFRMEKSRELLAYLVDREGSPVSRKAVAAILYEDSTFDRNEQKYLSRVALWLSQDLESAGIGNLFRNDNGQYSIDKTIVKCDLYDFLAGNKDIYHGEYMEQYSWGEDRKGIWV